MSKAENQKLKTLYVERYFRRFSDENRPVAAKDIVDYLDGHDAIPSERRSLYRDIAIL